MLSKFATFTKSDWECYSGAVPFNDIEDPLIAHSNDFVIIIDKNGITVDVFAFEGTIPGINPAGCEFNKIFSERCEAISFIEWMAPICKEFDGKNMIYFLLGARFNYLS